MSPTAANRLAWAFLSVDVVLTVAAAVLAVATLDTSDGRETAEGTAVLVSWLAFPVVGAILASRRAGGPIGWICLAVGLALGAGAVTDRYSAYALETNPGALPGGTYAAWFTSSSWVLFIGLIGVFLVLFFPDGKLPSARWRPLAWIGGAAMATAWLGVAFTPGRIGDVAGAKLENPLGIESAEPAIGVVGMAGVFVLLACIAGAVISLVVRYRRSHGVERQQLKWFVGAAVLTATIFFIASPAGLLSDSLEAVLNSLAFVAWALLPVAVGVAVLRYRLYDVDVVINRTLVYGLLTALLAGIYVGCVLLFQLTLRPLTEGNGLAVALSTLAVAGLFRPARNRIQAFVDRRFYRRKYDAERTLQAFAARLRDEVDLDRLHGALTAVVAETMQPAHMSLWLRDGRSAVTPAVTVPRRSPSTTEAG
jgi:hypothetical protein